MLEVGSGTGRIMAPLLTAGFEVCGVEPSAAMMARARERVGGFEGATLLQCSILDLDISQRFGTVILPLNTLWHLGTQERMRAALARARNHLLPRGRLLIDVTNPYIMADRGATGEVRSRFSQTTPDGRLEGYSAARDDPGEQTLSLALWYDRVGRDGQVHRNESDLLLRYVYRPELELLVEVAGYTILNVYGSYDLEPYCSLSDNILVVAAAGTTAQEQ